MLGKNITDQLQSNATVIIHAVNPSVKLQQNAVSAQSVSMQRLVLITCYLRNCKQVYDVINSIHIYIYKLIDGVLFWPGTARTLYWHHTLARQCESVVRATKQVNGETQNLTPRHAQTPLAIVIQIGTCDYVVDPCTSATVRHDPPRRFVSAHAWLCASKRVSFFWGGFLRFATAKGRGLILTRNTPKHAVPPKDVPFRGCEHKI